MKYASEELIIEHEAILTGLSILERMMNNLAAEQTVDRKDIESMIRFLRIFADTCHHGKEEGILFPIMEKFGIPRERGPIGQMLSEHDEGRALIRGMAQALEGKNQHASGIDTNAFVENARGYIELLRAHIQKENVILFPMGDRAIPESEQGSILNAFERHEETVIGNGIHEEFHAMLENLAVKYGIQ